MNPYDDDQRYAGRWGLSAFHTGIVYLFLAAAMLVYVAYQLKVGRVYTKSGETSPTGGIGICFLAIEIFAAGVGAFRGFRMVSGVQSGGS